MWVAVAMRGKCSQLAAHGEVLKQPLLPAVRANPLIVRVPPSSLPLLCVLGGRCCPSEVALGGDLVAGWHDAAATE